MAQALGLSIEEALLFWRRSFNKFTDDQFNKNYKYNIRHSYGLEGGRRNYPAKRCILSFPLTSLVLTDIIAVSRSSRKTNLARKIITVARTATSRLTTWNQHCCRCIRNGDWPGMISPRS